MIIAPWLLASATLAGAPPSLEVHEWGLLDVDGNTAQLRAGPPVTRPVTARKPVLYFHLLGEATEAVVNVDVEARTSDGTLIEHFPQATNVKAGEVAWKDVKVIKGHCRPLAYPRRDAPQCDGLDECEATELSRYESRDADCLQIEGKPFNHLFYRTKGSPPKLPLKLSMRDQVLRAENVGEVPIPGLLIHLHEHNGETHAVISPPPSPKAELELPSIKKASVPMSEVKKALHKLIRDSGLTEAEAEAFGRAWYNAFFKLSDDERKAPARRAARVVAPSAEDVVLYVLPLNATEEVTTVKVTPVPAKVVRFMLVRVALHPTTSG